ncbi:Sec-independent protein translocase protein TatB [Pseudonocardia kujensis]|uniref:Sec-independent protein translocase protein TatB n=1 Tax=Pseudonocardia kujensis TaxID=1128675 RepID=UPI001E407AD2|nr:Sec-independent protein translocase protein TatB [Pseudonocardia kujensis]MCE0766163.1 Sec-independent protein translocase protein TatB [Pseudonocardia kujensis]
MFDSVGWGEILVLVVAGLFILGPERLPSAAAWLGKTVRQVREYATGAQTKLRNELGPEFDELRKPLEDLRGLRNFNPRTAVRRTLFDDDPDPLGMNAFRTNGNNGSNGSTGGGTGGGTSGGTSGTAPAAPPAARPVERLAQDERPPIDPDAT